MNKRQFILTADTAFHKDGWVMRYKGPWAVSYHPSLPCADIVTREGIRIGWLLGYPVVLSSWGFCPGTVTLDVSYQALTPESIEQKLYELGGRFVAVFITERFSRLYLDASGSLSVSYALDRQVAASTYVLLIRMTKGSPEK